MSSMMVSRVPDVDQPGSRASIAAPGEAATAGSGNGHGASYLRRRLRRQKDGEIGTDEDVGPSELRVPAQPGEELRLGMRVDVLV